MQTVCFHVCTYIHMYIPESLKDVASSQPAVIAEMTYLLIFSHLFPKSDLGQQLTVVLSVYRPRGILQISNRTIIICNVFTFSQKYVNLLTYHSQVIMLINFLLTYFYFLLTFYFLLNQTTLYLIFCRYYIFMLIAYRDSSDLQSVNLCQHCRFQCSILKGIIQHCL